MGERFKLGQFTVKDGGEKIAKAEIRPFETEGKPEVRSFEIENLHQSGKGGYGGTRGRFGSLAITDRGDGKTKDLNFKLNPMSRRTLSVEEEELRAIDEMVRERVKLVQEEARKKGFQEGYADGLTKGKDEAFAMFNLEGSERVEYLDGFLMDCEGAKLEILKANEKSIVDIAFRVGRMLALKEIAADREFVSRLVQEIIETHGIRDTVKIWISAQDAESIERIREGTLKKFHELKNVSIEVAEDVKGGGARVETEWQSVDASLDTMVERVRKALLEKESGKGA